MRFFLSFRPGADKNKPSMKSLSFALTVISIIGMGAYGAPPTRPPTDPGTPALTAAGPGAEERAKAALNRAPSSNDAASNPTEATPGANPPAYVDGNFLIGPS